jgi:hypothetical protein
LAFVGGTVAAAIGIGVTVASYESASYGGTYLVLWGLVLVGVMVVLKGRLKLIAGARI